MRQQYCITFILLCLLFSPLQAATISDSIPTLGNSSSNLVSIEQEKQLGKAWLRKLRKHTTPYNNPLVTEYLTNLIYKLAPNSGVLDSDFSIIVLDNPSLNAFAVPGSIIGVNAGLFLNAGSEQEFASVIAHELAHLSQRHYARMLEQRKLTTPLTLAGVLASVILAATTGSDAGIAALASTQAFSAEQNLRFSRKNEQEADRLGIKIMSSSGFDPRAMPKMFERMYKQTRHQSESLPEYLSTHPLSETRISDTAGRAEQYPRTNHHDDIEFHLCRNIIISDYAETKDKAIEYFDNIVNKGSTKQIDAAKFGLAYAKLETKPLEAIKVLKTLLQKYPNLITVNAIYAKALINNKQHQQAIELLEQQLTRNPSNYTISKTLAIAYLDTNKLQESYRTLIQRSKNFPEDPDNWYLLAEVAGLAGYISSLHQARAEYFFLTDRLNQAIDQLGLALKRNNNELEQIKIQSRLDDLYELKKNPPF